MWVEVRSMNRKKNARDSGDHASYYVSDEDEDGDSGFLSSYDWNVPNWQQIFEWFLSGIFLFSVPLGKNVITSRKKIQREKWYVNKTDASYKIEGNITWLLYQKSIVTREGKLDVLNVYHQAINISWFWHTHGIHVNETLSASRHWSNRFGVKTLCHSKVKKANLKYQLKKKSNG